MRFIEHVKKAWYDAVLPQATEEERKDADFREYLLGWPVKEFQTQDTLPDNLFNGIRAVIATLTVPVFVLVKRVPEFLLFNFASEGFAALEAQSKERYGKDSFSLWMIPKNIFNILGKTFRLCVSPVGFAMWALDGNEEQFKAMMRRSSRTGMMAAGPACIVLLIYGLMAFVPPLLLAMLVSLAADFLVLPQLGEFRPLVRMTPSFLLRIMGKTEAPQFSDATEFAEQIKELPEATEELPEAIEELPEAIEELPEEIVRTLPVPVVYASPITASAPGVIESPSFDPDNPTPSPQST